MLPFQLQHMKQTSSHFGSLQVWLQDIIMSSNSSSISYVHLVTLAISRLPKHCLKLPRILTILPLFWMKGKDPPKNCLRMLTILPLFWGKCKGKRSVTDVRIYFLDGRPGEVDRHVLIIISRNTVINKNTRQHWICMGGKRLVPESRHLSCLWQSELSLLCQYLQLFINSLEGTNEIKSTSMFTSES